MARISNFAALLVFVLGCALWPASPSRAADACEFVTLAELERAFGIPFGNRYSSKIDNYTDNCMYGGRGGSGMVQTANATLPPGSELTAWRAQRKANMQGLCEVGAPTGLMGKGTFEIVPDLGEEAYACSLAGLAGPFLAGGMTMLNAAQGPNIFQIITWERKPGLVEAMAAPPPGPLPRPPP